MYLVTGGAGFIGSNLVRALNQRGITDLVVVDNLREKADKFRNLVDCEISDFIDKDAFLQTLEAGKLPAYQGVFHQGACSDTMETDGRYMLRNNYHFSRLLLDHCQQTSAPFLYASSAAVYGTGGRFSERRENESPLNVYGYSKLLFDQHVRRRLPGSQSQIVGFRYFNVYGPREQHKGRMASVAWHFFHQYRTAGRVNLFHGSGGYGDGEQRRDFVQVGDVVQTILDFFDHPQRSGIFNLGTGHAQTFNEVAVTVINACRHHSGEPPLDLQVMREQGLLGYLDFPEGLAGRYQSFTQADLGLLRGSGYQAGFQPVQSGVADYIAALLKTA